MLSGVKDMHAHTVIESAATIQSGVAKADGKLVVTEQDIVFEPFNKELGLGPYTFSRAQINNVGKCSGKGAGILPITADGIRITLNNNDIFEFILANPDEWLSVLAH
jgi:hypothetical protein|tara:strand:- start:190 stop:510 length:321 start_codon:yes stop_codon:yes gene_type:complete